MKSIILLQNYIKYKKDFSYNVSDMVAEYMRAINIKYKTIAFNEKYPILSKYEILKDVVNADIDGKARKLLVSGDIVLYELEKRKNAIN